MTTARCIPITTTSFHWQLFIKWCFGFFYRLFKLKIVRDFAELKNSYQLTTILILSCEVMWAFGFPPRIKASVPALTNWENLTERGREGERKREGGGEGERGREGGGRRLVNRGRKCRVKGRGRKK